MNHLYFNNLFLASDHMSLLSIKGQCVKLGAESGHPSGKEAVVGLSWDSFCDNENVKECKN